MTQEQAIQLIRGAIVSMGNVDDTKVLLADSDMPRPSSEHIWMLLRTDTAEGFPERRPENTMAVSRELLIEFEAIGDSYIQAMKQAIMRLWLYEDPDGIALSKAGISVRESSPATNVSALFRSSKEPRESTNITFGYIQTFEAPPPILATAIILDIFGNETLEYHETFEVT